MKNGDPLGALTYFAEFSGMKPYEFRDALLNSLAPEIDRVRGLTPEEYRQEQLKHENTYLQQQKESEANNWKQEQAQWELKKEIANIQETHNIENAEFEKAYYALANSEYEGEINPTVVSEYILHNRAYDKAEHILGTVHSSLQKDSSIVDALQQEIMKYPDWTDDQLLEIVREVFGTKTKQISKSVSNKVNSVPKKQVKQQEREKEQYLSFEDL